MVNPFVVLLSLAVLTLVVKAELVLSTPLVLTTVGSIVSKVDMSNGCVH